MRLSERTNGDTVIEDDLGGLTSRPERRRRRLGPVGVWPTLLTLGNLVAGFAAIYYAAKPVSADLAFGPWGWSSLTVAASLVLLGIVLDAFDGAVARLTDSVTELGGQLDSFADIVTFGVAPAFIMLNLLSQYLGSGEPIISPDAGNTLGKFCWAVAAIYVCCAALRLARFNVETASGRIGDHMHFHGLPTPGAAGAIVGMVLLHEHLEALRRGAEGSMLGAIAAGIVLVLPLLVLLAAVMMVSRVPYPHMANKYLRGSRSFAYLVRAAAVLSLAIWWLQETLAVLFVLYVLSGPWRLAFPRRGICREVVEAE
ncbi:MAG: CDP-alcohol phosphatidyltransferase family protein [Phycisphaerales bacterium]|jgi:CDP-diacylglycerol--serine O-phosphatidyltransferase|nr:CDP-alcohol phosphatidyltransferase family protein [Phycisphaerales bacterium]